MARSKDPTRLTKAELEEFRSLVATARLAKGFTGAELLEFLDWGDKPHRLFDALKRSPKDAVLAERAYTILRGARNIKTKSRSEAAREAHRRLEVALNSSFGLGWVRRYCESADVPAALIPKGAIRRIASALANDVCALPGFGRNRAATIGRAIQRGLGKQEASMALAWHAYAIERIAADLSVRTEIQAICGLSEAQRVLAVLIGLD